jgi:hypothetical protein
MYAPFITAKRTNEKMYWIKNAKKNTPKKKRIQRAIINTDKNNDVQDVRPVAN